MFTKFILVILMMTSLLGCVCGTRYDGVNYISERTPFDVPEDRWAR